jgi:hypothetical protein
VPVDHLPAIALAPKDLDDAQRHRDRLRLALHAHVGVLNAHPVGQRITGRGVQLL